jgi:hypothetical protein
MHPVDQELSASCNFASGSEHWEVPEVHDFRVEQIQKLILWEELHLPSWPRVHLAEHVDVHLGEQHRVHEIQVEEFCLLGFSFDITQDLNPGIIGLIWNFFL